MALDFCVQSSLPWRILAIFSSLFYGLTLAVGAVPVFCLNWGGVNGICVYVRKENKCIGLIMFVR